jgi:hypothetical protein
MEDMITEMQEEQAFEQELKEKGLRNIIGDMPKGGIGGKRKIIATKPHTSRLESDSPEAETEPKRKPSRRTRKTRSADSEPEPVEEVEEEVEEPTTRRVDPEVNDDGDYSDFSL